VTQIVLFVDSDYEVPAGIDRLTVDVTGSSGTPSTASMDLVENDINHHAPWPQTIAIVPAGDPNGHVEITVHAWLGQTPVATRTLVTRFATNESHLVTFTLSRACGAAPQCGDGSTCSTEACGTDEVPASTLATWRTERLAPDGITPHNLSGRAEDIRESPDAPDTAWLMRMDTTIGVAVKVDFPTPSARPRPGPYQQFRAWVRRVGPATITPIVCLSLLENDQSVMNGSVTVGQDFACQHVDSSNGTLVSGYADLTDLNDPTGAGVGLYVWADNGSPVSDTIEVGAVEWIASFE
jgi:hypothetical protein